MCMKLLIKANIIIIILIICSCRNTSELPPPNIIWLISEDNSPFIGAYGDKFAHTPNIDALAEMSVKFNNAFSNAPVCAPSRSTLISGMYATSMGTQHMRSENPSPKFMKFFPYFLKQVGYFTSNRVKKDYNTIDQENVWDIDNWWGWKEALVGRKKDQPFFIMYNTWMSHESKIHPNSDDWKYFQGTMAEHEIDSLVYQKWWDAAKHDPEKVPIPPYHPRTYEMKRDWAKYYDCVELMDQEIGVMMDKLKNDGFLENTIIFYFSDHGGVLARSKRFVFESGLRVPVLLHVPEKYKHLISYNMGTSTDDVVSFIDFAPTVLTLAGAEHPEYLQGESFAGKKSDSEKEYAFGFRGRMDERYDMVRTVRDKKFRYIRNYNPHRIYGGKVEYLWRAESAQSWERESKKGTLNIIQSAFWRTKPVEELYDIKNDPNNVNNLAHDPEYSEDLYRLQSVLQNHLIETKDVGIFPEAEMIKRYGNSTPYEMIRSNEFEYSKALKTANLATEGESENIDFLIERLKDVESVNRYWAAVGCAILKEKSLPAKTKLVELLNDESISVRFAAAEALYYLDEEEKCIGLLTDIIKLPQMGKEIPTSNIELYSNHFAITHAFNVIDALDIITPEIGNIALQISKTNREGKRSYDRRMAQNIVAKFNLK